MTDFGSWFNRTVNDLKEREKQGTLALNPTDSVLTKDEELLDYNDPGTPLRECIYPCRVCNKEVTLDWLEKEVDFDPIMVYCGCSPRCCP